MAFDDSDHMRFHAVEREIETAVVPGRGCESKFALPDRQRRRAVSILQAYLLLGLVCMPEREQALPPAYRHPARGLPWRMRLGARGFLFCAKDCRHGRAKFEIAGRPRSRRQVL